MFNNALTERPESSGQTTKGKPRLPRKAGELLGDHDGNLPVWIRAPRTRQREHYTGLTRAHLYALADKGVIVSKPIRDPGKVRGIRLFLLRSILDYIERN